MSDFGDSLAKWDGFYGRIAGASATLVGLLFVAVSIHPRIANSQTRAGLNALITQIPDGSGRTRIIGAAIIGAQGLARLVSDIQRIRTGDKDPGWRGAAGVRTFADTLIANGLCFWVMVTLIRDANETALGSLVAVTLFLLIDALDNCWSLLKGSARTRNEPGRRCVTCSTTVSIDPAEAGQDSGSEKALPATGQRSSITKKPPYALGAKRLVE